MKPVNGWEDGLDRARARSYLELFEEEGLVRRGERLAVLSLADSGDVADDGLLNVPGAQVQKGEGVDRRQSTDLRRVVVSHYHP